MTMPAGKIAIATHRASAPLAMALACVALWALVIRSPQPCDLGWYADAIARWRHGAVLYQDVIEINPPLIFYVYSLFTLGLTSTSSILAATCALILLSALWCRRLEGPWAGVAALVGLAVGGFQGFGQRDHLAIIFALPYVFARQPGRKESIALGAYAFLGLALKPHFLAIALGASAASAISTRSWRPLFSPANWTIAVLCLAYLAAVPIWHPEYFDQIAPLGLAVYGAFDGPLFDRKAFWAVVVVATGASIRAEEQRLRLSLAAIGALASFLMQGKGFDYHLVPAVSLMLVILMVVVRDVRDARRVLAGAALLLVVAVVVRHGAGRLPRPPVALPPDAHRVLFLTTDPFSIYPQVTDQHLVNVSRYPGLWPVPGALTTLANAHATQAAKRQASTIMDLVKSNTLVDIERGQPDYVLVDHRDRAARFKSFSWLTWISSDPRFHGYRPAGRSGDYDLLRRDEEPLLRR
jgi:hypothetical protein